mmetsp:Transcript_20337/g.40599  ORF Transcript_20337/g.40599 Transcript_20337/m.40599 type:complete len:255 (+) Transcript_20337:91-855(+)
MTRDHSLYMAKLSGQSNRFGEMMEHMREVVKYPGLELNSEERILFNCACKNHINSCREQLELMSENLISDYNWEITNKLFTICNDIIRMIDNYCLPTSFSVENIVNYNQIKGDCYKYLGEIRSEREHYVIDMEAAHMSYLKAYTTAKNLHDADPMRITLALNLSNFYRNYLRTPKNALALAKAEYRKGMEKIDELPDPLYKKTTNRLQRLREQICDWEQLDLEARLDLEKRLDRVASRTIMSPSLCTRSSLSII